MPPDVIVAIALLLLSHVPPDTLLFSVVVLFSHTFSAPVIVPGRPFTTIVTLLRHPLPSV
jgi:hypothetical protein